MVLVGRMTKDAVVNTLKDDRQVVNFSIAINDYYKPKGQASPIQLTSYVNCAYWMNSKIAERLKKGTLLEISGRLFVNAYTDMNGNAKASLHCHINNLKIHGAGKEATVKEITANPPATENSEEVPF